MHIYLLEMPRTEGPTSFYIGQRKYSPEESTNYYGSGTFCLKYRKKHTIQWIRENVKKTILLRDLPNQEALSYWETFAIADYRDRFGDRVVNSADGGIGGANKGERHHFFGKTFTAEHRANIGKGNKGKVIPDEVKEQHSKFMTGLWQSDEFRSKAMEARREMYESEDIKNKISKSVKELWQCEEYREKQRKARKIGKGEKCPSFKINSVRQILNRIEATEGIRIPRTSFERARKNPKHEKHAEYMELFNRYKVEEK